MKWFENPEDKARGFWLKAPYDKIMVGCDPRDGMTKESADSFDVFVNVSDSPCAVFEPSRAGQHMHWYPVNECGLWNLSYLFWLKTILDYHFAAGHRIYLHCHAGAYRSPSAAILWLQSRGHTPQESLELVKEKGSAIYRLWEAYDNIPKLKDNVFSLMNEHPTWSLGGILHRTHDFWNKEVLSGKSRTNSLLHKYFWFYYQPKWWIKSKWTNICLWYEGSGYFSEGIGTYIYKRKHFWAWARNAEPADPSETVGSGRTWDVSIPGWGKKAE